MHACQLPVAGVVLEPIGFELVTHHTRGSAESRFPKVYLRAFVTGRLSSIRRHAFLFIVWGTAAAVFRVLVHDSVLNTRAETENCGIMQSVLYHEANFYDGLSFFALTTWQTSFALSCSTRNAVPFYAVIQKLNSSTWFCLCVLI